MTNYLSVQVPKEGMSELNEEMLMKHADFVVHQVGILYYTSLYNFEFPTNIPSLGLQL